MRLFYGTPSLIGSINDSNFILANQLVVLMGLIFVRIRLGDDFIWVSLNGGIYADVCIAMICTKPDIRVQ